MRNFDLRILFEIGARIPHVRWARWQAKQALLAFFLRGLMGSLAFVAAGFWPFWATPFPLALFSVLVSGSSERSAMSPDSWSPPLCFTDGDGEPSLMLPAMLYRSRGATSGRRRAGYSRGVHVLISVADQRDQVRAPLQTAGGTVSTSFPDLPGIRATTGTDALGRTPGATAHTICPSCSGCRPEAKPQVARQGRVEQRGATRSSKSNGVPNGLLYNGRRIWIEPDRRNDRRPEAQAQCSGPGKGGWGGGRIGKREAWWRPGLDRNGQAGRRRKSV